MKPGQFDEVAFAWFLTAELLKNYENVALQ
jgi:hypothetical protein